jgi:predicted lipid-binding transport protein (Tim44 family)
MSAYRKVSTLVFAALLGCGLGLGPATDADARAGSGSSFGSRGTRTFGAPPATQTAPRGAAPIERSMTQPGQNSFGSAARPQRGGLFSGGFGSGLMGGLVGGLLGAGLFGLFTGHGLFGGMSGFASLLGLVLQLGLLFLLVRFVMNYSRNRKPAPQGAPFDANGGERGMFSGLVSLRPTNAKSAGFGVFGSGSAKPSRTRRLDVTPADFTAFEQRLTAVQSAYSREDRGALSALVTSEMVGYFASELAENAREGLHNEVSDVKFLQGDLSEAWREDTAEYATVAMRFSAIDTMVDRTSNKIVSGNATTPQEATEIWTFMRQIGGTPNDWRLSAIQQA